MDRGDPEHHRFTKLELRCHPLEIDIAIGTGLRKGNQYGLMWDWIDLPNRLIHIPRTKNGDARTVPIIDRVADALNELREIQTEMEEIQAQSGIVPIRMCAVGRIFNVRENKTWWAKALRETKIKDFRWYDLRHTTHL